MCTSTRTIVSILIMFTPQRRYALASTLKQKIQLAVWDFCHYIRKALGIRQAKPHTIACRWRKTSFFFEVQEVLDLHVLNEVFLSEEYIPQISTQPNTILDLGANIGASTALFSFLFPDAHIIAVEPNPECYARLQKNTSVLHNRITPYQEAVAKENGAALFYRNADHWGGSLTQRTDSVSYEVTTATLESILERSGVKHVDILKIDIEGGEYAIAEALQSIGPEYIIAEVHPDIAQTSYESFRNIFSDYQDIARFTHKNRTVVHMQRRVAH